MGDGKDIYGIDRQTKVYGILESSTIIIDTFGPKASEDYRRFRCADLPFESYRLVGSSWWRLELIFR